VTIPLKVKKYGNSLGVILPKEAIARLGVSEGDGLFLTEGVDNSFRVTPEDPEFARQMKIADSLIKRYRNALRELAK